MNNCVKCKQLKDISELNKHSKYSDVQRYICKSCNKERVALRRNLKMYPQNVISVSTNIGTRIHTPNEPVSTTIVDTGRALIEAVMQKHAVSTTPTDEPEEDDYTILLTKNEVPDYYV